MSGKDSGQPFVGACFLDVTAAGAGNSVAIDVPRNFPFQAGFGCVVVSGTPTYTMQHTFDGTTYFDHPFVAAKTVSADGNYNFPIKKFRLNFAAAGRVQVTMLAPGFLATSSVQVI